MHNNQNTCPFGSMKDVLDIGTTTADPMRVKDGETYIDGVVQVTCTVSGGFDVNLVAYRGGPHGGTLSMGGHVDVSGGGQSISAEIDLPGANYKQDGCTITFTYGSGPVLIMPPVAKGRIWAHLACTKMVDSSGGMRMLMDGTQVPNTCRSDVDFIFENCAS
jgi:hypothetical protein